MVHKHLIPLTPFGNLTYAYMDNEVAMIDKDYDHVFDMDREGDVFTIIALENNAD